MLQVVVPTSVEELDHARALMRTFVAWHRARHQQDITLIDLYFDAAEFETELAALPGEYAPPRGQMLLATLNGTPAAYVALREVDAARCEMKRMFDYPEYHRRGVGRALGEAVLAADLAAGYRTMLLDTSVRQAEAQALYRQPGFRDTPAYYDLSDDLRQWLVFME
jgi:GNAT superfamily N-acetyltransferase